MVSSQKYSEMSGKKLDEIRRNTSPAHSEYRRVMDELTRRGNKKAILISLFALLVSAVSLVVSLCK